MDHDDYDLWKAYLQAMRIFCFEVPADCGEAMGEIINARIELVGQPDPPRPRSLLREIISRIIGRRSES